MADQSILLAWRAALLALLFALSQALFAAHAGDLDTHAPQSCELCLAAAISDDPAALEFTVIPPTETRGDILPPQPSAGFEVPTLARAFARAPPLS